MVRSLLQILLLFFPFLLAAQGSTNNCQNCTDFQRFLQSGKIYFENTDFDQALIEFQAAQVAARVCGCNSNEPAERIAECITGIQQQKDEAIRALAEAERQKKLAQTNAQKATKATSLALEREQQAQRLVRSNLNALTALELHKTNPTQALRMAEMNYHLFPESSSAAGIFQQLITDPIGKYQFELPKGHKASINAVAFSPDGQFILTGAVDAILWDREGNILQRFEAQNGIIHAVAFSPDGKYILTGNAGGKSYFMGTRWANYSTI